MTDLSGKVIAVAGAGGSAGRATVARLTAAGATVAAADADASRVGGVAGASVVDLLDAAATRAWIDRVEQTHGRLDGLVHLVGGWRGGKELDDGALADWAALAPLLVETVASTSVAAREALVRTDGRFAVVSATGAHHPTAGNAAYAAAKAAAEAWTLALADSFAKSGAGAAVVLVVKALVDDAMRAAKPDAAFAGFTHVDELAETIAGLWARPTRELNRTRQWMIEP